MASSHPRMVVRVETMWYVLSAIFFTIGIIGTLGEYVFHWWDEPFDWAGPAGLVLGALTLVWGASSRQVRKVREDQRRLLAGQERLIAGQAEQTAILREHTAMLREHTAMLREMNESLREVVASFRRQ